MEIAPNAPSDIPLELLTINDTHPNGRAFAFERVDNPVNGSVYVPPGGGAVARFEPSADFAASGGSFTSTIADSRGGRSTATVPLLPGPSAPVAQIGRPSCRDRVGQFV